MNKTIELAYLDDWMGLYINGKLVHEGHSLQEDDLLRIMQRSDLLKDVDLKVVYDVDEVYGKNGARGMPQDFSVIQEYLNDHA